MPTTDKRKKKEKQKKSGRKDPTQQTKINLTAIAPPATTRKPYDNLISFVGTKVEELADRTMDLIHTKNRHMT